MSGPSLFETVPEKTIERDEAASAIDSEVASLRPYGCELFMTEQPRNPVSERLLVKHAFMHITDGVIYEKEGAASEYP